MVESPGSATGEADARFLSNGSVVRERYEVVRRLKAGGMGAVYEVLDRQTSRRRALKTLLPSLLADQELMERFEQEVRVAANVESEHVVEVLDAGVDTATGLPFLVMELLRGETLGAMLEQRGPLPAAEVVALLRQVSLALERTHDAGIVHRDLKPENLFVTKRDDGAPRLKILDFGIAKLVSKTTVPGTTRNFGTPAYMAPEQLRGDGDIDGRADLYSLGHIAYVLLVGQPYWATEAKGAGGVYTLLLKIMQGALESASVRAARSGVELPRAFDAWFARAVAIEPSARFESATELVEELGRVLGVAGTLRPKELPASPRAPAGAPRRLLLALGALALALAIGGAVLWADAPRAPAAAAVPAVNVSTKEARSTAPLGSAGPAAPLVEPLAPIASTSPAASAAGRASPPRPSTLKPHAPRAGTETGARPKPTSERYDPTDLR